VNAASVAFVMRVPEGKKGDSFDNSYGQRKPRAMIRIHCRENRVP